MSPTMLKFYIAPAIRCNFLFSVFLVQPLPQCLPRYIIRYYVRSSVSERSRYVCNTAQ